VYCTRKCVGEQEVARFIKKPDLKGSGFLFSATASIAGGGFPLDRQIANGYKVPQPRNSAAAFALPFHDFPDQSGPRLQNWPL